MLRRSLLVLVAVALALAGLGASSAPSHAAAGATCADADLLPEGADPARIAASTLCLLNGERADAALRPLKENGRLAAAALAHAQDMVAGQYFSHVAPDGRDVVARVQPTGYLRSGSQWTVGENLAWGTGTLGTPRSIVAAWMRSPGHRDNILRASFREIGLGIVGGNPRARDGLGATYATVFGATRARKSARKRARARAAVRRGRIVRRARAAQRRDRRQRT
jgi:uncharacterized protein YkwD